jgi:hypothetical protein
MWDIQTLERLNREFEAKSKLEREEREALGGEEEFEEARQGNRVKD